MPPDLAALFEDAFARVGDEPLVLTYSLPMVGGLRHFEARLVSAGRDRILSTVHDVSRERVAELAASVVHEVNQPLSAIMTNAQAGLRYLDVSDDKTRVRETLTDIVTEVKRARDVVVRTRELFRSQEPLTQQPFSIAQTVHDVLHLIRPRAQREATEITVHVDESLPCALGDRVQVQQALLNLFVNGLDALDGASPPRRLSIGATLDEDHRIRLSVSDNGPGLAAGDETSIFNPFYTTKRDGLGLGLVVSRSIAQAHGGRLWLTRNEGAGVTFWLTLPVAGKKG
jgi:two-component system sensor kinase FixL